MIPQWISENSEAISSKENITVFASILWETTMYVVFKHDCFAVRKT